MRTRSLVVAALAVLGSGCASVQSPVPVAGEQSDIASLAGEWAGEYSSAETGRGGSIVFKLSAARDTA